VVSTPYALRATVFLQRIRLYSGSVYVLKILSEALLKAIKRSLHSDISLSLTKYGLPAVDTGLYVTETGQFAA
jgi:hypothetical protein